MTDCGKKLPDGENDLLSEQPVIPVNGSTATPDAAIAVLIKLRRDKFVFDDILLPYRCYYWLLLNVCLIKKSLL
jgi:hypothetical protein